MQYELIKLITISYIKTPSINEQELIEKRARAHVQWMRNSYNTYSRRFFHCVLFHISVLPISSPFDGCDGVDYGRIIVRRHAHLMEAHCRGAIVFVNLNKSMTHFIILIIIMYLKTKYPVQFSRHSFFNIFHLSAN